MKGRPSAPETVKAMGEAFNHTWINRKRIRLAEALDERDRLGERRPGRTDGTHRNVLEPNRRATEDDEPIRNRGRGPPLTM